ncbi:hypothetical protein NUM3379_29160 [Kineococcus sp. NUM-3379]
MKRTAPTAAAVLAAVLLSTLTATPSAVAADPPAVGGAIARTYDLLGGPASFLGDPVSGENPTPRRRGVYQLFEGGSIYWSPGTGAWEVHGAIRDHWGRLGWENGPLGFPVVNETGAWGGRGSYSAFETGTIYWSPETGAHEVRGAIRGAYGWSGWHTGVLGFPVSDEIATPDGRGAYSLFEGGSIYWTPETGAHLVYGAIRDAWGWQGWENGVLGYPTSSEFTIPGGRRVNFEGGYVEWSAATGARVNRPIRP